MIWSTPVTGLQLFGYTIALGGLIYYKLGREQFQAAYMKLASEENSMFNRFRRSLLAKVGAGVLVIVVLAMVNGFLSDGGIDPTALKTGLSGVREPEMVDTYHPRLGCSYAHDFGGTWDNHPTHNTGDVDVVLSTHPLDIVLFISPSSADSTLEFFEEIRTQSSVSTLNPRITVYGEFHSSFPVTKHVLLDQYHLSLDCVLGLHFEPLRCSGGTYYISSY